MHLKRLEIQGFKTFATRTVLEFRPGITAIVGPNGSGKSNFGDAIRWVLGEQSYAALRSKRSEDLIFGGGTRRAPSGFAEVSLTIDNSDRLLPLPYSEVTITRRVTRAGEYEYQINRNRVRLRELQEAIAPLGGSYTLINQGLVDSALNLRPEERRRLFEDAAEISVFEQRKADAERRLRETDANIQRCDDVLADLEPRLRSLKRQASLARSYRELQAELHSQLVRFYTASRLAARQTLASAETEAHHASEALAAARARQSAASAAVLALRGRLRAMRERLGELHASSSALHTRAEAAQRDLAVAQERGAALVQRAEDLERQQHELELRRAELEHERTAIAARLAEIEERLAGERLAATALEQEQAARNAARQAARQALEKAQRAELAAETALTDARRRMAQLTPQRERLLAEHNTLAAAHTTAQQALETRQNELQAAQAQVDQAATALGEATAGVERSRQHLDALRSQIAQADEAIAQARRVVADSEARLESLSRLQRSYTGTFAGVKAAMHWAESQKRGGFILVASILRVPAELETALEVALGSRLQNIVVEQWADAEAAIEALRKSGSGRATFLPLDTLKRTAHDERRIPAGDGVLGVAAGLVEFDPHYEIVVWSLLGRTLVVRELSTARRELRNLSGGWGIVTLGGEQVSAGGAVTGGAQIRESGTLRRERELRELPEQVTTQRKILEEALRARKLLDEQVAIADHARRDAEAQRRRVQQEQEAQRDALDRARRAVQAADGDLALRQRRYEQVSIELAGLDAQERTLAEEQHELEGRLAEAHNHLAQLRAEEQNRSTSDQEAQQRLGALRATVAAAEAEVRAERSLLHTNNQNRVRLDQQHETGMRRITELGHERVALESRNQELAAAHAALLAEIDELRRQIEPTEAELENGEAEQATQERHAAELTTTLLEQESAHGKAEVELQRAQDRLNALWERAASDDIDLDILDQGLQAAEEAPDAPGGVLRGDELQSAIQQLKSRIQRLGVINPLALEEYEETSQRYEFLSTQLNDLRAAEHSLSELIGELDQAMRTRFETTFHAVAAEFERSFEKLFGGGEARLMLTQPSTNGSTNGDRPHDDMAGLGVDIIARPPGKRQQTLALLSGGERALTAAALLFAILKVNPSPFCVMDEVDAALDEANVGRFRDALAELSLQTQFLIVTHNRGTIEAADTIYGVSMGDDSASRVLSLRLEEIEQ